MENPILRSGGAVAEIALLGAEPLSWRVDGRELIWHGDPAHWAGRAPILFPVVGASNEGQVRVNGQTYPMPQHGFARGSIFALVGEGEDFAHFRLTDTPETRRHYPFEFQLDVTATLGAATLTFDYLVFNPGTVPIPYALGFHPAFPWPFAAEGIAGHAVEFEVPEDPMVPSIVLPTGVLDPNRRPVPMEGNRLPLAPDLFAHGALIFLDVRSREMRFTAPSGAAIGLEAEDFPHLAVWTRPNAPFVSLEAWTGHADWSGFTGELSERNTMRVLAAGSSARHRVTLRWHGA
ncbi:MAG TPA: aldose 1-epimerase family protein [Microvirga sp.]|jgi:galactose mutarotase-like enzyme|nr:aldose 1-epimerase family protein [Microvirga sp.]